ncbi:transporter substrate-binding domain-containing protein [Albimonas sp. CAU 1670]|uniref:substrate-binding periplasmic protein n=1 Tax=Albimonas sp. CAU 1670 TaxID=3032599 RepID=UPI0023DB6FF7|nr:transporter substrate-binding domain-containing protein [Albimonas sp. CAU 1670]MDF2235623.1 transporter substrate-binding domain-containing protein [Albimonas sp. CAU 1670]
MPGRRPLLAAAAAAAAWALLLPAGPAAARCEDWTPQPRPQNASRDVVGQSLDDIQARGWIDFAVYEAFPPWSWEEDGAPKGVDVELGRIIAADLGVEPRFTFVAAGETLDDDLRNHVWKGPVVNGRASNVMLHVPYDSDYACRVDQVVFAGRYFTETLAIAYAEAEYPDGGPVPAYFRFDPVAVENDSLADFHLSSIGNGALQGNIRRYASTPAAMEALARGEVKAAMGPLHELEWGLVPGLAVHSPPLPGLARGTWTLGVAVRQSWRPLGYAVDDAVRAAVEDGRLAAVFEAYGLSWTPPAD